VAASPPPHRFSTDILNTLLLWRSKRPGRGCTFLFLKFYANLAACTLIGGIACTSICIVHIWTFIIAYILYCYTHFRLSLSSYLSCLACSWACLHMDTSTQTLTNRYINQYVLYFLVYIYIHIYIYTYLYTKNTATANKSFIFLAVTASNTSWCRKHL
jgi:hypothetical protein